MKNKLRIFLLFTCATCMFAFFVADAAAGSMQPYGSAPAVGIGAFNPIPDNPGTIVTPVTPAIPGSGHGRVVIPNTSRTGATNLEHPCVTAGVQSSC